MAAATNTETLRKTMRAWHADPAGPAVVLLARPRDAGDLLRRLGA